jgi:dTDP-4-amino-4,6-dideoxygalactose transaminase
VPREAIHISQPDLGPDVEESVLETLRSGMIAQGPRVAGLEDQFRAATGAPHAIAVNSGTAALIASLHVLGLDPGDEVITTPFTFAATLNAIIRAGVTARFADIGPDFNIDPTRVESLVNDRTRVILPVHLYGLPVDMDPIIDIAVSNGLRIVEDAAQAIGAEYDGRPVGSFDIGCFSLYATKNVTTGEGGVVTTGDDEVADRLRLIRNQGMRSRYDYVAIGENLRLTDLQAAIGIPQMDALSEITNARRSNASALTARLDGLPGLIVPTEPDGRHHAFHQYTVRVTEDAPLTREDLIDALASAGIGSGIYYPRVVWDYDIYRDHPQVRTTDDVQEARRAALEVLSLPVHPLVTGDQIEYIADTIIDAFATH